MTWDEIKGIILLMLNDDFNCKVITVWSHRNKWYYVPGIHVLHSKKYKNQFQVWKPGERRE